MPTIIVLLCGAVIGAIAVRPIRKAWRKARKTEDSARDASEQKAYEKGKVEGKAEALSVLCDTDENAAIIEALGQEVLVAYGVDPITHGDELQMAARMIEVESRCMWSFYEDFGRRLYRNRGYRWADAALTRAGLEAKGPTPRDAYKSYLAQREAAKVICEQLDELERVRKEQAEATRA